MFFLSLPPPASVRFASVSRRQTSSRVLPRVSYVDIDVAVGI